MENVMNIRNMHFIWKILWMMCLRKQRKYDELISIIHIKHILNNLYLSHHLWMSANLLAKIRERIAINLIRMFKAGPDVSFRGSPTVSPTTAALWISVPFVTLFPLSSNIAPLSMYFFALSQAPPVFAAEMAIWTPLTKAPGKNPARMLGPKAKPRINGVKIT